MWASSSAFREALQMASLWVLPSASFLARRPGFAASRFAFHSAPLLGLEVLMEGLKCHEAAMVHLGNMGLAGQADDVEPSSRSVAPLELVDGR